MTGDQDTLAGKMSIRAQGGQGRAMHSTAWA